MKFGIIPNRSLRPAILPGETWREGTRIRTLANLSKMSPEVFDAVRAALKGGIVLPSLDDAAVGRGSLPHGHFAARLIDPGCKLACARAL